MALTATETAQRNFAYTTVALKCSNELHQEMAFPMKDSEAIYPGMLLLAEQDTEGDWYTIKQTADATRDLVIALALEKREVGQTVHDVYIDGENVSVLFPKKGDKVLVRVLDGESVNELDYLVSNGDGTVRVVDSGETDIAIFQAVADCNMAQSESDDEIALVPAYVL